MKKIITIIIIIVIIFTILSWFLLSKKEKDNVNPITGAWSSISNEIRNNTVISWKPVDINKYIHVWEEIK